MKLGKQALAVVVSAEHASAAIPPELDHLGLDPEILRSHVAWDPGAREVASYLAESLRAPLFLGEQSRLVADLNRSPDSPEVVPAIAFGVPVPGNHGLSPDALRARIARYHEPYWSAVRAELEVHLARGPVVHLSVHSFTGDLNGEKRHLDLGLLYDPERPLEHELAGELQPRLQRRGYDTRHNEPYDGRSDALVTANRARYPRDRYAGFELELSHNLLPRIDAVAIALAEALGELLR